MSWIAFPTQKVYIICGVLKDFLVIPLISTLQPSDF